MTKYRISETNKKLNMEFSFSAGSWLDSVQRWGAEAGFNSPTQMWEMTQVVIRVLSILRRNMASCHVRMWCLALQSWLAAHTQQDHWLSIGEFTPNPSTKYSSQWISYKNLTSQKQCVSNNGITLNFWSWPRAVLVSRGSLTEPHLAAQA